MSQTAEAKPTRRSVALEIVRSMWRELHADNLFDAAAGAAFWLLLSIPAAVLAVLSSVSVLGDGLTADLQTSINEFVDRTFTSESSTIRDAVDEVFTQQRPGVLSVSVLVAIFTLARGFAGLIRALDVAYDIEEGRRFLRLRLTSIGLAIGTLLTVALSTSLWVGLRGAGVPTIVRLMVALAILVSWAATLYHVGPHHRTPWRYDLPGAAFTALGWLVVSIGFGYYVRLAADGNQIVGAAGTALLALTWLWLACLVFLIGAELNEILAARAGVVEAPRDYSIDVHRRLVDRIRRRDA
ncbi:MAG: YihY/virulence factor BrkB family protein [Ilumatobacter sp.]|nr:YihY/virulence factor BrkB family protein [Ilumatobacter sp.]